MVEDWYPVSHSTTRDQVDSFLHYSWKHCKGGSYVSCQLGFPSIPIPNWVRTASGRSSRNASGYRIVQCNCCPLHNTSGLLGITSREFRHWYCTMESTLEKEYLARQINQRNVSLFKPDAILCVAQIRTRDTRGVIRYSRERLTLLIMSSGYLNVTVNSRM